jgi:hypothetical protein
MRASFLILMLPGLLAGTAPAAENEAVTEAAPPVSKTNDAPEHLAKLLAGDFSNAEQARTDFNYRNVVLHVVRIWPDRSDGPWLYLEQALADAPTQPYRQQVYQLVAAADGGVVVQVFNLPDPVALTAAWHEPRRFDILAPDKLVARPGCSLHLKVQPDSSIKGSTEGCNCPSELSSAAYASTELTVTAHALVFWDRGFTAKGTQIWGPANTGYEFRRAE